MSNIMTYWEKGASLEEPELDKVKGQLSEADAPAVATMRRPTVLISIVYKELHPDTYQYCQVEVEKSVEGYLVEFDSGDFLEDWTELLSYINGFPPSYDIYYTSSVDNFIADLRNWMNRINQGLTNQEIHTNIE